MTDRWPQGLAYESYMGRWSRALAARFVEYLAAPASMHWLDVGCGTGALTQAILELAAPASVTGCDGSPAFVEYAQQHQSDSRVRFEYLQMPTLPSRPEGYDIIASSLVLNFLPSADEAMTAMVRAAAAGGVIAAGVWDYAQGMQYVRTFWDAASRVDPPSAAADEARRFAICTPERLASLFTSAGLTDVQTSAITIDMPFRDFADYWQPMLGGIGPVGTYLAKVAPSTRDAIGRELERTLPRTPDGGIPLTARAFVVSGRT